MNQNDKKAFYNSLLATGEIYGREISSELAKLFFEDLSGYPIDAVLAAFSAHRKDPQRGQYFPKPADLIDKLEMPAESAGVLAWAEALRLATNARGARHPEDRAERAVQAIGGWQRLGMTGRDKLSFLRSEFLQAYSADTQRDRLTAISSGVSAQISDLTKKLTAR